MKKEKVFRLSAAVFACICLIGCAKTDSRTTGALERAVQQETSAPETFSAEEKGQDNSKAALPDGVYTVDFDTDSSMFHVSEACGGKGTLTVADGSMTVHISLTSKNIKHLFPGTAEEAKQADAKLLAPTIDTVTYSDGISEDVHGFDVPVPALDEEFALALIGAKGKWYDHKVRVSNPVSQSAEQVGFADFPDGEYAAEVTLTGGSGRAGIDSPAVLRIQNKTASVRITWSSPNYDYMKVGGTTYLPINTEGNSVFEFPIDALDTEISVIADTVAMGTPHEITYQLTVHTPISPFLTYEGNMQLDYAEEFSVSRYHDGYALISLSDGSRFLVVPEGRKKPEALAGDIVVLQQPVDRIYLAASAVMDMLISADGLDFVSLSGIKADAWQIAKAREAMESGKISYAGKYNMPDYEKLVSAGCRLAVESTMIFHAPEVKERLEALGIPVLVDRSSYEKHPLGRTEWVKLYGVLLGKEDEADEAFRRQKEALAFVQEKEKSDKSVAFFFINANGAVNVRKAGDLIPNMIALAGGRYVFSDLGDDTSSSSVNMQMETFFAQAKDADYLIYNSAIEGELHSKEELLLKSPLLKEFRAFSEGNVFCTTQNFYQESMKSGSFILDLYRMMNTGGEADEAFSYLFRLE